MSITPLDLTEFDQTIRGNYVEVSSSALGAEVVACSDDFFASRHNLIKPTPSLSMKGQFGPNGALYDGWESRRHNPAFDWVIIRLAAPSSLHYVDIDTSHFSGNEAPQSQVFALNGVQSGAKLTPNTVGWVEVLPVVDLGPNSRHVFPLAQVTTPGQEVGWGAVMVRMIPDGGMARFRAFGLPVPPVVPTILPRDYLSISPINLLDPLIGARIVSCSDANFSPPTNLLLPGRGHDMSDGWETRRSQHARGKYAPGQILDGQERKEWVVAKLGVTGVVVGVEVDTAFHPGNYPVASAIEATLSSDEDLTDAKWTTIVTKKPLGPHRQHFFDVERDVPREQVYSHIRYLIYPDGGSKRVRIYGHPLAPSPTTTPLPIEALTIPALPLTPEAFRPYGQVIMGHSFASSAPKAVPVTVANQGTAYKFHRLGNAQENYPPEHRWAKSGLHVGSVKAKERVDARKGIKYEVKLLERHMYTTQAFIPLGNVSGSAPGAMLVVVALNGKDDKPDPSTLRAFLSTAAQGVSYNAGVWHHSVLPISGDVELAIVEATTEDQSVLEYVEKVAPAQFFVQIPPFVPTPAPASTIPINKKASTVAVNGPNTTRVDPFMAKLQSFLPQTSAPHQPIPMTSENFSQFGQLISTDISLLDSNVNKQESPDGLTVKYDRLAPIINSYDVNDGAILGISVFRSTPKIGLERGKEFDIRYMERHKFTSQTFVPMGKAEWKGKSEEALQEGGEFLVIVAENGPDDRPDPKTMKSFILQPNQGLSYSPGVWHHPVLILDTTVDLACIEAQISTGLYDAHEKDCELLSWEQGEPFGKVAVPEL